MTEVTVAFIEESIGSAKLAAKSGDVYDALMHFAQAVRATTLMFQDDWPNDADTRLSRAVGAVGGALLGLIEQAGKMGGKGHGGL